jgi:hypothetical protein
MIRVEGKYKAKKSIATFFKKDDILLVKNIKEREMCTECDLYTWNGEFLCRMSTNSIVAEMLELIEADEPTKDKSFFILVDSWWKVDTVSANKEYLRQRAKKLTNFHPYKHYTIYRKEEEL